MKRGGPLQTRTPLKAKKGLAARPVLFAVRTEKRPRAPKAARIDKSLLTIGTERRERSSAHMAAVAQHPCCICGVKPVTVHHLTHAQPKARGLKSGDQWTVPLCPAHHQDGDNAVHRWAGSGGEAGWWAAQGFDALALAERLWSVR